MMATPALIGLLATASKSTSTNPLPLIILLAVAVGGYFFFFRPQQAKAKAARAAQGSDIEVGDEVQTIGGIIGTVLEIHGDRYTLLTGALNHDGNLDGPQPTRIVLVRQAIARKVDPVVPANPADADPDVFPASDLEGHDAHGDAASGNHTSGETAHEVHDADDEGAGEA
jgi:preprotein translocase YajC subunit